MLDFESKTADELIKTACTMWGSGFKIACAFALEDLVIIHKVLQHGVKPTVFFIDTGRHFEHTYAAADAARAAFGIPIQWVFPDSRKLGELLDRDGPSAIVRDADTRRRCCDVRRIEPLNRALKGATGWMIGARRSQCSVRSRLVKMTVDKDHDWIPRMAPLADWSWQQVVEYVNSNQLPCNQLFRRGYASVGCSPCTRPIKAGETERSGRWPSEDPTAREHGDHISGRW